VDSPPWQNSTQSLAELLTKHRAKSNLSWEALAAKLDVSLSTLKNWEHGWTQPSRQFWPKIRAMFLID
jgi:DNA-binding transcriptional regulator YiaG